MQVAAIDAQTARTAKAFVDRLSGRYEVARAILFGSRARQTHRPDSDADIAIVIRGSHSRRSTVAMDMADIAFDVMLDTGVLVEPLPLWEDELADPASFGNPALIRNIVRDGVTL